MQYPSMGKNRQYRITIPQLNGGVNYAVPPHLIEDNQLSDVKNMWYKDGRLQTRPGLVGVSSCNVGSGADYLRSIKAQNKICVLSSIKRNAYGGLLFSFFNNIGDFVSNVEGPTDLVEFDPSMDAFVVENIVALKDGRDYEVLAYGIGSHHNPYSVFGVSPNGKCDLIDEYVPTIMKGGKPTAVDATIEEFKEANGTLLEPYNLLTPTFKCDFVTDGKGVLFSLPEKNLRGDFKVEYTNNAGKTFRFVGAAIGEGIVKIDSTEKNGMCVSLDCANGTFKFLDPSGADYAPPFTNIEENVVVTANRSTSCGKEKIYNMKISTWYGGGSSGLSGGTRLFVAGNPDEPNVIRWSALNNPLYFPENNYAYVGSNASKITAFGKQNELLVIFKENEMYCSYYVQGTLPTAEQLQSQEVIDIEAAQAMFPIYQLHPEIGCDCPNTICLCNNRLVWFNSNRKVYGLFTTGQYNERNVRELSYTIEKKLKETEGDITKAIATEFEGKYLLHIGDEVFVMDYSSSGFSYYSSYSSDEKSQKAVTWLWWKLCEGGDDINMFGIQAPKNLSVFTLGEENVFVAYAAENYCTFKLAENDGCDDLYDTEQDCDENMNMFEKLVWVSKGIAIKSYIKTKLFDFGYPERLKRINPFYLQASGANDKKIKLTYFRGNGDVLDDYAPTLTGKGLEETDPIRITPNANRVREFGVGLESDGRVEIGSLTLNYSMMGAVR